MRYFVLFICVLFISCGNDTKETNLSEEGITTTYYLIRHAEKDRSTIEDPSLLPKGKERAAHWAAYFDEIDLDAVYSTDYNRTKETAQPTASKKGLTVQFYNPAHLYDSIFQKATAGKKVLVVGHSNTTPAFVNTIIGTNVHRNIDDTENGMLYTVILPEDGDPDVTIKKVPFN